MQDRLPPDRRKPLATRGRKLRRTQSEQMSSGSPSKADIARRSRDVANVHNKRHRGLIRILRRRVGTAQENRCAFDRRSLVAMTLRGARDHILGDPQTYGA